MAVVAPVSAHAEAKGDDSAVKFSIEGSTRARFEGIDGQFRPGTDTDDVFLSFRTLVAARLDVGDFMIGGEIDDARGYLEGDKSSVKTSEVDALEPIQAYAAYRMHNLFAKGDTTTATAGRFAMSFGANRLVGRTDAPNTVPTYLGVMADWSDKKKDHVVAFWTKPVLILPTDNAAIMDNEVQLDRGGGNMVFFGADATAAKLFEKIDVEFYGFRLVEADRSNLLTRNRRLNTFGTRLFRGPAKGKFDFEFEGALQRGTERATTAISDLKDLDVNAGFAHVEGGWTVKRGWTPRFSAMFDYASADGTGPGYGRFDSLFGARRADFGPVSLYGPIGRANLISPGVRVEAKPSKRLDLMAAVRGLWLADATDSFGSTGVRDKTGASGDHAGTQIEARARRWLVPSRLRVEIGAAYLAKGYFLRHAPNAPATGDTRYGYTDLSFSF